jgi:GT2 family glycosyltransferase
MGLIITVARNNLHLTKKAVASALAQDTPTDVLVVDNDSDDGTGAWLCSKAKVYACFMTRWQSLAYCWNHALTMAFREYSEVLVINNDVELRPDTYNILKKCGHGSFVTGISVRTAGEMDKYVVEAASPHPDFSCFMIHKECWEKVGKFDEGYFPAYVEDCDYHVRMHRAGIRAVAIDLPFLHHGSGTLKSCSNRERIIIEQGAERNRERFKEKYGCYPGTPEYQQLFT